MLRMRTKIERSNSLRYVFVKGVQLQKINVKFIWFPYPELKGAATLIDTMFYMKELNKPWILMPVSSKSVEKCESCGRLNICKWAVMEAAIL